MDLVLKVRQYGAFGVYKPDGEPIQLGAKHQALLALLITAEEGVRTRAFLEHTLWSFAQPEQAKASLRTALSTLRKHIGPSASSALMANRERVTLDLRMIEIEADTTRGAFMEGFELPHEHVFAEWLSEMRSQTASAAPAPLDPPWAPRDRSRVVLDELLPSIAVLPFVQRSPGGSTAPLGAILSEELSRQLSRSQAFSVTSYMASRQFSLDDVRPAEVSSVAGVSYLVSGSVFINGHDFIAQIDLHDSHREKVIWSREFRGTLSDLLMGQSGPLRDATSQIGQTVVGEAVRLVSFRPLSNLANHTLLMASIVMMQSKHVDQFEKSNEILDTLMEREMHHPVVLTWAGIWQVMRVQKGLSADRRKRTLMAENLANAALAQDPAFSLAHTLKGMISSYLTFEFDSAQYSYDKALQDNPNEALALLLKGATRAMQNHPDEGMRLTEAARKLTPLGPQRYYFNSLAASVSLAARDYDRAIELADQSLQENDSYPSTLRTKAIALQMSGRGDEARDVVESLMRVTPDFSLSRYMQEHAAAFTPSGPDWASALREAGVPE
ncbi:tetratricopeptide repeat protein [Tritonibacter scottomollicae]|uniref:Tetratricopeptide repeat protein n=1 Tax=Tritonibacter scottomollicae TaxID=483013 RepID=A0ABZ0HHN9_TRISK|nr:tetratricopeptide repeat protein [Tritonibacter scottomollicae]WOI33515.1 tetratricopeptide repeat protein [Tritonibacter scottomollicae]